MAAGAIAKELLRTFDVEIRSCIVSVGDAGDPEYSPSWDELKSVDEESPLRAVNRKHEEAMIKAVDAAREAGEKRGGTIVVAAHGVTVGLGSYVQWSEKLDGRIGQAILSVHAVKAVAVGDGVAASRRIGSEVHDPIYFEAKRRYHRETNRAGGLEGGVTNGQDVVVRAFMKPISTLRRGLPSVDIDTGEQHRSAWERSDVTAVPACGVVCEAMLALVLAGAMREKFGGDSLGEMRRNYDAYLEQLAQTMSSFHLGDDASTFNEMREKIDRRAATAEAKLQLGSSGVDTQMQEIEREAMDMQLQDKLLDYKRSMGLLGGGEREAPALPSASGESKS